MEYAELGAGERVVDVVFEVLKENKGTLSFSFRQNLVWADMLVLEIFWPPIDGDEIDSDD